MTPESLMNISGSVALVSGANRGLGQAFARELVRRDAAKVYGAARDPAKVTEPGVLPVALDITDGEQVARVAAQCADVSLLVNNAGVLRYSTFTNAPDLDAARTTCSPSVMSRATGSTPGSVTLAGSRAAP